MTLREALRNKKMNARDLMYRVNSWQLYGEDTVLLFFPNFSITDENLDRLLDYLALVDRLALALPQDVSEGEVFCCQNLQSVDALVLYDEPLALIDEVGNAKIAFQNMAEPDLPEADRKRMIYI